MHKETGKKSFGPFRKSSLDKLIIFLFDKMQGILVSQIDFLQLIKYLLVNKSDVVLDRLVKHNVQKFLRLSICSVC